MKPRGLVVRPGDGPQAETAVRHASSTRLRMHPYDIRLKSLVGAGKALHVGAPFLSNEDMRDQYDRPDQTPVPALERVEAATPPNIIEVFSAQEVSAWYPQTEANIPGNAVLLLSHPDLAG